MQQEPGGQYSVLPPALFSPNPFAVPMPPLPPSMDASRSYHHVPPPRGLGGRGGRGGRGRGAREEARPFGLYYTNTCTVHVDKLKSLQLYSYMLNELCE